MKIEPAIWKATITIEELTEMIKKARPGISDDFRIDDISLENNGDITLVIKE
jgi:hypothetical protein